jgi:hypothetical protein
MSESTSTYVLGNHLRGFFEGAFSSVDEAWSILSRRFLLSYPTESGNGRSVIMKTKATNVFGYQDWATCKEGVTALEAPAGLSDDDVLAKAARSILTF